MKNAKDINDETEQVILVGLKTKDGSEICTDATLDELESLVNTAGGVVVARVVQQKEHPDKHTFIGEGKAIEIGELSQNLGVETIIFDNELSPSQTKHLEEACKAKVIDRSLLILDIFAERAQTKEGRVQVELARLKYVLPRLAGQGAQMSRLGGGGGGSAGARRGAGETKLEVQRRHVRGRIDKLSKDLAEVRQIRDVQRSQRQKNDIKTVAIVGYTNAGKSTLLNRLCKENIQANDRLFDTLDPTTRRWRIDDECTVLVTDTVGFIRKLPHHLIEAFKATLEELKYADIILHVVDSSHPEWKEHAQVTEQLIEQLGSNETPCIRVFNKIDKSQPDEFAGLCISAKTGKGIDELGEKIKQLLTEK